MLGKLLVYTCGSGFGLYLAVNFVPQISYSGGWPTLAVAGVCIALLNLAIAPILKLLSLPLRILTLNLFSLVIDMSMVWLADALIPELKITGLAALLAATLIIAILNSILWLILSPSFRS
jgi:Predicted membrane protein